MALPSEDHLSARDAMEVLSDLDRYQETLTRRALGLAWIVMGFAATAATALMGLFLAWADSARMNDAAFFVMIGLSMVGPLLLSFVATVLWRLPLSPGRPRRSWLWWTVGTVALFGLLSFANVFVFAFAVETPLGAHGLILVLYGMAGCVCSVLQRRHGRDAVFIGLLAGLFLVALGILLASPGAVQGLGAAILASMAMLLIPAFVGLYLVVRG